MSVVIRPRRKADANDALAKAADAELRQHAKLCADCHRAGRDVTRYCDTGYEYARTAHLARQAIARRQLAAGADTLF